MATTSCGSRGRIAASGLKNLFATLTLPRVGLVPVTADAATLYETWVGWGGEGIVLKEPTSGYRPGIRSPAWLKVKPKVTLEVIVTGGSSEPIPWGDGGMAVMLDIALQAPSGWEGHSDTASCPYPT